MYSIHMRMIRDVDVQMGKLNILRCVWVPVVRDHLFFLTAASFAVHAVVVCVCGYLE
jgi:hypothetical protein